MNMKKSDTKPLKKSPKSVKPTTRKTYKAKKLTQIYPEFCTSRDTPYPPILLQRLADDYIEWARQEDSLILGDFALSKGMSKDYFKQLCAKNEIISNAHKIAKEFVAHRREKLMLLGKLREKSTMYTLYQYNDDWDAADKRWSEMKKDEDAKGGVTTIVLDPLFDAKESE